MVFKPFYQETVLYDCKQLDKSEFGEIKTLGQFLIKAFLLVFQICQENFAK